MHELEQLTLRLVTKTLHLSILRPPSSPTSHISCSTLHAAVLVSSTDLTISSTVRKARFFLHLRLTVLLDENDEDDVAKDERLERLASFQQAMIAHAIKFPSVQKIVYSTCSIHAAENERVVRAALEAAGNEWMLAPRSQVLPTWPRRGLQEELGSVGTF